MLMPVGALAVVAGALALGCSGNGYGGDTAGSATNSTAGTGSMQCIDDTPCDCGSGLRSVTQCDSQGQQSCDCASCPSFDPNAGESPFQACGGAPFGSWLLKSHDVSAIKGRFTYSNALSGDTATASCDSEAHELSKTSLLLVLRDGGTASVQRQGESLAYSVLDSCLAATLPVDCATFKTCRESGCGVCACTETVSDITSDDATWSSTGTTLSIDAGSAFQQAFDYCVNGDQLTLQGTTTFERFTLTRTNTFGTPSACATRTLDQCASDGSCYVGKCVGTGCPAASAEASCTNHIGCTWDSTVCSGKPKAGCGVADYGVVPGCIQSDTAPHCTGDAAPCSANDAANGSSANACMARTGCVPTAGCTGEYTTTCAEDVLDCGSCAPGCTCTGDGLSFICSGVSTCSDQPTYGACLERACDWLDFATCEGTPISCASLSADACTSAPGCVLTAQ